MLIKNKALPRAFGLTPLPPSGLPPCIAIASHKVNEIAEGGQDDISLGLPPPPGERGESASYFFKSKKIGTKGFLQCQYLLFFDRA